MKIAIVRGAFLNPFELQNYYPLAEHNDIKVFSSLHPINSNISLPLTKLPSPTDLPNFPFKYPILNRIFTDAHYLLGLENKISGSDIAHVAETYYHYTIQAIAAKKAGKVKKVISTVWEIIPKNNEGIRGRKHFKQLSYENIDHFIAITHLARKALLEEGVGETKITVIPMGINLNRFKPIKKTKKTKTINILSVARLVSEKGIDDLVYAFENLSKKYPIKLTLVGDGPLKYEYRHRSGIFFKSIPYSKIHMAYQQADIFCLASQPTKYWQEQYGMVLIEAMASGLPIATTTSGAIPEVCEDVALYSPPKNRLGLQSNLERLIANPELRDSMGKKSRRLALAKYNMIDISKKIQSLYQKVLNES